MPNTVRVATQVTGVGKSSSELDRLRDKFDKLQKQGAKGFAIGAGAAATTAGLNIVASAIGSTVDVLRDATKAAIADEESQNRLRASLSANIPAWSGNTQAIERNIKAAQRLGFDDETLRDSLTVLAGATHDVAEAERIQAIAMDLARFKGIDLRTASESLIKVEAGVYRSLKSLGIVLKDGATRTEALAAVQAVAAGQAEAYAATTGGKAVAATVALDEAMENLGRASMPLVTEAAKTLTNALDRLSIPLEDLQKSAQNGSQGAQAQLRQLEHVADVLGVSLEEAWRRVSEAGTMSIEALTRPMQNVTRVSLGMAAGVKQSSDTVGDALGDVAVRGQRSARAITKSMGDIADEIDATWSELSGAAEQAAEDIFGPLERRAELAANMLAQSEAMGEIQKPRQKGETQLDFRQRIAAADAELTGLEKDYFTLMVEMAGRGELTASELSKLFAAIKEELKTASHEESVSLLNLLGIINRLRNAAKGIFPIVPRTGGAAQGDRLPGQGGARAHGGPVAADKAYVVGEKGPELFVPNSGGAIVPNAGSGRPLGDTSAILNALNQQTAYLARIAAGEPNAARPMTARGDLARQAALMPGGRL